MSSDTRELQARVEELERKLVLVTAYCEDLEDRITKLAVAKVAEPRFPFWNWQLARGMSPEDRRNLSVVLSVLDDLVAGTPISEQIQKHLDGMDPDVLAGDKPLEPRQATDAIKAVTGIKHEAPLIELLTAIQGQGMFRNLCPFLLKTLDNTTGPTSDDSSHP